MQELLGMGSRNVPRVTHRNCRRSHAAAVAVAALLLLAIYLAMFQLQTALTRVADAVVARVDEIRQINLCW
jgi:ADP-ribosylglycohydrolase